MPRHSNASPEAARHRPRRLSMNRMIGVTVMPCSAIEMTITSDTAFQRTLGCSKGARPSGEGDVVDRPDVANAEERDDRPLRGGSLRPNRLIHATSGRTTSKLAPRSRQPPSSCLFSRPLFFFFLLFLPFSSAFRQRAAAEQHEKYHHEQTFDLFDEIVQLRDSDAFVRAPKATAETKTERNSISVRHLGEAIGDREQCPAPRTRRPSSTAWSGWETETPSPVPGRDGDAHRIPRRKPPADIEVASSATMPWSTVLAVARGSRDRRRGRQARRSAGLGGQGEADLVLRRLAPAGRPGHRSRAPGRSEKAPRPEERGGEPYAPASPWASSGDGEDGQGHGEAQQPPGGTRGRPASGRSSFSPAPIRATMTTASVSRSVSLRWSCGPRA